MSDHYKILKVLNNSSLLVTNGTHETIIVGKGIGFKRSVNDVLDEGVLIEKEYHLLKDVDYSEQSRTPKTIIQHTAIIMDIVQKAIDCDITETSIISLSNHLAAMLVRIENDEVFFNPFHYETLTLYPEGYRIALNVNKKVREQIGIELPESEIDFLTLYLHGLYHDHDHQSVTLLNAVISDVNDTLENELEIRFDKSSTTYARFIMHLKFLVQRITKEEPLPKIAFIDEISSQYADHLEMSEAIAKVLEKHLHTPMSMEERVYISLHLARLTLDRKGSKS